MSAVAFVNDDNDFAPSVSFRSSCKFVGDCFGAAVFFSGAAFPQENTSAQSNHLRIHTMISKKMCADSIVYWFITSPYLQLLYV